MFQVVHAPDEALVYCTVSIWHGTRENVVFGVGGDKAVAKFASGIKSDDEAFKKAFTDAIDERNEANWRRRRRSHGAV
jgi:hypothetical protein